MSPITQTPILFTHNINVRIDDLNFGNHLCHTKFLNLIHNARALFLKIHNLSEINCFDSQLIMLNLNIKYISQCFFNDLLEINLTIGNLDKASFSFSYLIVNKTSNKLAAEANTVMGFVDIKRGKLKRIPIQFLNLFRI